MCSVHVYQLLALHLTLLAISESYIRTTKGEVQKLKDIHVILDCKQSREPKAKKSKIILKLMICLCV